MVNESRRYRDEVKLYKVIESCTTEEQIEVASDYISAYEAYYDTFELGGRLTLLTRCNVLRAGVPNET